LTNYKAEVAYDGSAFSGYQIQNNAETVESSLTSALSTLLGDVSKIQASGRTDSGVHAEGQVISFKSAKFFDTNRILYALNSILPSTIWVKSLEPVTTSFDPRRDAMSREYRYHFVDGKAPIYMRDRVVELPYNISLDLFDQLAESLIGKKDFVMLRKKGSNETSTVREIYKFSINKIPFTGRYGELDTYYYEATIVANAFLYRMVRNIMGAVFEVLRGKESLENFRAFLKQEQNNFKYTVAPAKGLTLVKVKYEGE
jgi:tRNA pseudouridine38-40 synthase